MICGSLYQVPSAAGSKLWFSPAALIHAKMRIMLDCAATYMCNSMLMCGISLQRYIICVAKYSPAINRQKICNDRVTLCKIYAKLV